MQAFSVGRHLAVQLVALTIEREPAAAERADRLVAAALRLASEAEPGPRQALWA